jgi:hypothetical protein
MADAANLWDGGAAATGDEDDGFTAGDKGPSGHGSGATGEGYDDLAARASLGCGNQEPTSLPSHRRS